MNEITKAIDSLIERTMGKNGCVTAVQAAEELDKLGILKDSKTRRGKPLRNILRSGQLPQAKQDDSNHWYIYHSSSKNKSTSINVNKQIKEDKKSKKMLTGVHHIQGLEPIFDNNSKILILGTMPGSDSLEKQEYYASNNNSFWFIMKELFNGKKEFMNYEEKISCLKKNNIALWDIYKSCDRQGSADKNIKNVVYNNINNFIKEHPNIKHVVFNGEKASTEIQINVDKKIAVSTSNAYPMSKKDKKENWEKILKPIL